MGHVDVQPLTAFAAWPDSIMQQCADEFLTHPRTHRTVREFATTPVPYAVIEACLKTALTAPSVANQQPWSFVWVQSPEVRRQIRAAAEAE